MSTKLINLLFIVLALGAGPAQADEVDARTIDWAKFAQTCKHYRRCSVFENYKTKWMDVVCSDKKREDTILHAQMVFDDHGWNSIHFQLILGDYFHLDSGEGYLASGDWTAKSYYSR